MRRFLSVLFTFVVVSCMGVPEYDDPDTPDSSFSISNGNCVTNDYAVTREDILSYISSLEGKKVATRGTSKEPSVVPVLDIYGDTVFFAVNLNPGWKLFSSDKRTPAVLAESASGSFDLQSFQSAVIDWFEFSAKDVRSIKNSYSESIVLNSDVVEGYSDAWRVISKSDRDELKKTPKTRADPGYDLYSTFTELEVVQEIPHIIQTRWHQKDPYNLFCPFKNNNSGLRAPAGCVAVAGAQMLNFLHGKIGRPGIAPTNGYCYGDIDGYSQHFYDSDSTAFSSISSGNDTTAALLVGFVGQLVGMEYGNSGSGATTSDLVDVFEGFGISCDYDSYNQSIVQSHLMDEMPVIVRADGVRHTILGIPYYSNPHAFIIDGFRRKRYKYTNLYVWAWTPEDADSLGVREYNFDDYYIDVTYSSSFIDQIKMNWGYIDDDSYNTWYTLTGNWHVSATYPESDYDYRRHMIYDFSLL